jgi:hypothetical protein
MQLIRSNRDFCRRAAWLALAALGTFALAPMLAPAQATPTSPPLGVEAMMVKNALTAVNHANLTGNYTVLRDLGTEAFRSRNSAAELAAIFQNLRAKKFDLSPILMLEPVFTQTPGLNGDGQLVLVGYFPTRPLTVQFQVGYAQVGGGWLIDSISVGATPPAPQP